MPRLCPRRTTSTQHQPTRHTTATTSHSTHLIAADRVLARSHNSLIDEERPGTAIAIDVVGGGLRTGKPRQLFTGQFRGGSGGISAAGNWSWFDGRSRAFAR